MGNDSAAGRESKLPEQDTAGDSVPCREEQIGYVADMILELKQIAEAARLDTLAGLLDLAHSEAQLRMRH